MTPPHLRETCWPNSNQLLLLKAALLSGDAAMSAWAQWSRDGDLQSIEAKSSRLLPAIYVNLRRHHVESEIIERLAGIYRYTWYKNQMLLKAAQGLLSRFEAAGMQPILLKGMALALDAYGDLGLRPMNDIDIFIEPGQAEAAFADLSDQGWKVRSERSETDQLKYTHSLSWQSEKDFIIDVHWYAITNRNDRQSNAVVARHAKRIERDGFGYRIPAPSEHLLLVIDHGLKWERNQPALHWIMDSWMLLTLQGEQIEWERLIEEARARRLGYTLFQGLSYLQETLGAPVPGWALDQLGKQQSDWIERWEFQQKTRSPGILGMAPLFLVRYLAFIGPRNLLRRIAGLPAYLAYITGAYSPGALLGELWARLKSNVRGPRPR